MRCRYYNIDAKETELKMISNTYTDQVGYNQNRAYLTLFHVTPVANLFYVGGGELK